MITNEMIGSTAERLHQEFTTFCSAKVDCAHCTCGDIKVKGFTGDDCFILFVVGKYVEAHKQMLWLEDERRRFFANSDD